MPISLLPVIAGDWALIASAARWAETHGPRFLPGFLASPLSIASPPRQQSQRRKPALPLVAPECDRRLSRQNTQLGNPQIDARPLEFTKRCFSGGLLLDHAVPADPEKRIGSPS
jgi:hypothetical protein